MYTFPRSEDYSKIPATAVLNAIMAPEYSPQYKVAGIDDLGGSRPLHLGVLLESSEYDIALVRTDYHRISGQFSGCVASIQQHHLKIITHELHGILYQELVLHSHHDHQKISFFIVPNIFDLSCNP